MASSLGAYPTTITSSSLLSFISSTSGPLNLKAIGTVYFTRTSFPLCLPGVYLGIVDNTRMASVSSSELTERATAKLLTDPSFSTMKCAMTRPCIPLS